jgi:hypothetical protein
MAFGIGLLAFLGIDGLEVVLWTARFGGTHEAWFLNSGPATAVTVGWLFALSLIGGALQMSGPWFAAGAFVAMTGVLFLKPGGPGNIFPIVMLFGGLLIAGSCLLGAWLGKEAAGRRR